LKLAGFAAVIFDMDGVLVDGEPLHFRAVNELLAEDGLSISLEAYKPYMGTKTGWRDMARDLGLRRPLDEYAASSPAATSTKESPTLPSTGSPPGASASRRSGAWRSKMRPQASSRHALPA
jgi:beta-phosphoglucomutase-like phosphatase (HAD superfamily)